MELLPARWQMRIDEAVSMTPQQERMSDMGPITVSKTESYSSSPEMDMMTLQGCSVRKDFVSCPSSLLRLYRSENKLS